MNFRRFLINFLAAALAGMAAVMIILAALLPFHLLIDLDYAPMQLTNAIIEYTPPDNAIWLQNALGPLSFPWALLGGIMLVGMCGGFSGIGFASIRRWSQIAAIAAASAILPVSIAIFFPVRYSVVSVLPLLLAGPLIALITRNEFVTVNTKSGELAASGSRISRRALFIRLGVYSIGGIVLGAIDGLPAYQFALNAAQAGAKLFDFKPPVSRVNGFPVPGDIPEVSAVADFYVMRKSPNAVPPVRPDWRLSIDGLVAHSLSLSLADVQAYPRVDVYLTRQCVSNPVGGNLISTALMSGAPLADVLNKAGVHAAATQAVFYGRDGYAESVPLADVLDRGLLVYAMNGVLLPDAHGAPLKVEVPGLYGFRNMKWLTRIELVEVPFRSIWMQEGWTALHYKTTSRIDLIAKNPNGGATVSGIAFAGLRGVQAVEVQVNGGVWRPATLHTPPISDMTWTQWRLDITERGALSITVRATDGHGSAQIAEPHQQFPDGASGLHSVTVEV